MPCTADSRKLIWRKDENEKRRETNINIFIYFHSSKSERRRLLCCYNFFFVCEHSEDEWYMILMCSSASFYYVIRPFSKANSLDCTQDAFQIKMLHIVFKDDTALHHSNSKDIFYARIAKRRDIRISFFCWLQNENVFHCFVFPSLALCRILIKKVFTPSLAVFSALCFFYVRRRGEIEREIIVKVFGECDENTQNIFQIKFIRIFRSFICCRDEPSSCRDEPSSCREYL